MSAEAAGEKGGRGLWMCEGRENKHTLHDIQRALRLALFIREFVHAAIAFDVEEGSVSFPGSWSVIVCWLGRAPGSCWFFPLLLREIE